MNKAEKTEAIAEFLREEGYVPKIDDDGDLAFKMEGKTFFVIFDEADQSFVRIVHPNFWSIDDEDERSRVEQASLKATAETKVAKVFPIEDDTWASIELFSSSIENTKRVFPRALRALSAAISSFLKEMRDAE